MTTVVYVSSQCPNCDRFVKSLRRLQIDSKVVNIDRAPVNGLTAVPTVVVSGQVMVGTAAFEWLQGFEAKLPLEAYATVLGEGCGGLSYTELESEETMGSTLFANF